MEAGEDRPGPFPGPPAAPSPARRASSVPRSPHRRGTKPGNGRRRGLGRSFRQEVRAFSQDSAAYRSSAESGGSFFLPPLGRREGSGLGGPAVPRTPRTSAFSSRRKQLNVRIPLSPQTSKWYWDYETQSLKFKSPMPISEIKDKIKRGKSVHFVENDGTTTTERLSEKRFAKKDEKSTKGTDRRSKNDKITLDDAKYVALFLLQDTEMQRIYSFTTFMRNKNLDEFLMALLYYLSHYLQKLSLEKKPKSYMASHIEKKEMELVIEKLQESQKYLAQKYCILVLGLGMPDMHHMACGKEKVSDTQKDWKFFEAFFTFCTYVAWVVFRREYLREIDEEIGRLFRTNMFNSARRRREDEESGEKKRMTFVQFRRMMAKRPAIKTTIHMRSPALSTILPSPKEHAQHLFEKNRNRLGTPLKQSNQKELVSYEAVAMPVVGILGEPRSLFNTTTLLPNEQEQIEQTQEPSKRNISLINENNAKVQQTLELAMKAIGSPGLLIK